MDSRVDSNWPNLRHRCIRAPGMVSVGWGNEGLEKEGREGIHVNTQ